MFMSGFGNATVMFIMLYSPIYIAAIHRIERNRLQQLIRSGRLPSFCQFLKGRAVTFEDAGSHDINGFLFSQFQIWILFQIDQTVFGPAVLKNDDCSCLVRKLGNFGEILVCFCNGYNAVAVDVHIRAFHPVGSASINIRSG